VLSIGKLAVGQAGYYLEQAHGSVSRAGALHSGVEDYYLGGPEAAGVWVGDGGRALGLVGAVDAVRLDRVLAGEHPTSGVPLGRVLAGRVPGFDLTFSAPKSVSVLFGIGDDELRGSIRDAHDRAVAEAFGYVARAAGVTRRGPAGVHVISGRGLIAAAFRHRTSRAGDPQLHTHVLVANVVLGADGCWSTLDGRRIYAHAKTAGYLYEARLRSLLTRELGLSWGPMRNGIADVDGVPPTVLRAFSRRRADIEAELERRGASSAGAAQVATLVTRRTKDYDVSPEQLVPEWRERARELGLDHEVVRGLVGLERPAEIARTEIEDIAGRLAGSSGLTARRSSFTRRDVLQAWSERVRATADVSIVELERFADDFLVSEQAVVLAGAGDEPSGVVFDSDGRMVPTVPRERSYSTPELLALERRIIDHALTPQEDPPDAQAERAVERAIESRPSIADEQAAMVRRLVLDPAPVAVVVGQAGTGKTFALGAASEAWEASGHRVRGAALARRAARELEHGAEIESTSLTALIETLRKRPLITLGRNGVLVIDEAGMVPTRELAEIVEHVQRAGAKLVLVGDHRQLPELGAGGPFRGLLTRVPVIELTENRRQAAEWERAALALVRTGAAAEAVGAYERRERIVVGEDADAMRGRLVADWWATRDPDGALMIAHRRVDVADLNGRAHALMRAAGELSGDELPTPAGVVAVGDRVVLRRNDPTLNVVNGDRGIVVVIDRAAEALTVELGARRVTLGPGYLEQPNRHGQPALEYGYAITGHLAQGMTCRRTFVLATDQLSREWAYVALSRGAESNRLYVLEGAAPERLEYAPGDERQTGLVARLMRSEAQELASDHAIDRQDLARVARDLADAERDRGAAVTALRRMERERPRWYRPADRRQRARALNSAREETGRSTRRVQELRERQTEMLGANGLATTNVERLRPRVRAIGRER
jgi:conjugative relaxase-like TrwC/TraI family protein